MKKFCLALAVLLLFSGCTDRPGEIPAETAKAEPETTVETTAETTAEIKPEVTPLTADLSEVSSIAYSLYEAEIHPYGEYFACPESLQSEEFFYPLNDGCWAYTVNVQPVRPLLEVEQDHLYRINRWIPCIMTTICPDGTAPERKSAQKKDWTAMFLLFDTGEILSSRQNGRDVYLDGERIAEIPDKNEQLFAGAALRGNRYFRICSSHEEMRLPLDTSQWTSHTPIPRYALFRYLERLTEFQYYELYASGEIFVGLYYDEKNAVFTDILSETGEILRTEEGDRSQEYPEEPNVIEYDGLTVQQDEATGLYYYANAAGNAVCEPAFTECTNIKNGTAVVQIGDTVYMLVVDAVE